MAVQEVITLNTFGLEERRRTTSRGTRSRYTIRIKADPLVHVFDPEDLGRGPAQAIAAAIRDGIRRIGDTVAPATSLFREKAKRAFDRGAGWATSRYAGGRTGSTPPGGRAAARLFNDSGRFADGVVAGPGDGGWTVNVPANRLDPSTFRDGAAGVAAMQERLVSLVPELGDAEALMASSGVRVAVGDSIARIIFADSSRMGELQRAVSALRGELIRRLAEGLDLL